MKDMKRNLIDLLSDNGICTDMCSEYGEPGYSLDKNEGLILFGDWNQLDKHPNIMQYLEDNYAIEWLDEWVVDYDNDKAYRCSPDSYAWQPSFILHETGEVLGVDFINEMTKTEFIELCETMDYLNNPKNAINLNGFEPKGEEVTKQVLGHSYPANAGLYEKKDDNSPEMLKKALESNPLGLYYFVINGVGQFDMDFLIYKLNS